MATAVAPGYDQDIHRQLAAQMDTTGGIISGYLSEVLPQQSFPQPLDPQYLVKAEVPNDMHVVPQVSYMTMPPMAIDPTNPLSTSYPPEIVPGATYASLTASSSLSPLALSTPSPPVVTSPSLVSALASTSATFSKSSLDAALVPNGPLTSPTRSANSMSPVSAPSPFGSLSSQSPPAPPPEPEEVVLDQEVPLALQKGTVNQMLDIMVQDLLAAKTAVNTGEGDLRELQSRIATISRMAANITLTEQSLSTESLPGSMDAMTGIADFNTYAAPPLDPSPPLLDPDQSILEMPAAGVDMANAQSLSSMPLEVSLPAPMSDQSRKRNASAMQSPPISAVLKHEPSEEGPLLLHATEPLLVGSVPSMFPATSAIPLSAQAPSRPATRPPTPQSAFATTTNFLPSMSYGVGPAPMVLGSSSLGTPLLSNPSFSSVRPGWPEQHSTVPVNRHHHSLSAGSIIHPIPPMHIAMPPGAPLMPALASGPPTPSSLLPPQLTRTSRSGSLSNMGNSFDSPFNFDFDPTYGFTVPSDADIDPGPPLKKAALGTRSSRSSAVATNWYFGSDAASPSNSEEPATAPITARNTPSDDEDEDSSSDSELDHGRPNGHSSSSDTPPGPNAATASDIPAEYRSEVDRIFFEYLDRLCSDLDARDSKGDQIHQPLMMKKMQRLDESPDWRGFKFRIQAFTSAFLEELAKQGYPEDKIPMKKVRNYLWHQPHIQRFNEDGKKAKSKGNHIWNIEARRRSEAKGWEFRPFKRKLAGSAAPIAYTGLKWSWTPRVWDPQSSFSNVPVKYSSPNLPLWLTWKDDTLCGIPPADAESCTVMVTAEYTVDGVKGVLTRNLPINIAPVSSVQAYPRSRRQSVTDTPPRRSSSDSALNQVPQRSKNRANVAPVHIPGETPSNRVIRVLQNVAQRVDEETQLSQLAPLQAPMQEMAKSKQVLRQTVNAMDQELTGHAHSETKRLAIAAQQVVIQAAANVIADRNVSIGRAPVVANKSTAVQRVSVNELSDATHDAIVQAVKHNGPASSEVDIIVTAASILKAQAPVGEPHPPSTAITRPPTHPSSFIQNLAPLPEHA